LNSTPCPFTFSEHEEETRSNNENGTNWKTKSRHQINQRI
jgi:hypothetical protein